MISKPSLFCKDILYLRASLKLNLRWSLRNPETLTWGPEKKREPCHAALAHHYDEHQPRCKNTWNQHPFTKTEGEKKCKPEGARFLKKRKSREWKKCVNTPLPSTPSPLSQKPN